MRGAKLNLPVLLILVYFTLNSAAFSQEFPERPVPPKLVNDYTGLLNADEALTLERKLLAFSDSTSTQIAIVTVQSLMGYAISDYAQRLAEKWGIGQKGLDNGVLILVKPKTAGSRGEVFIAPGYGLEGVIPDLTCSEIVDFEVLPEFRAGNYFRGLDNATNTLMSLARGEFSASEYSKTAGKSTGDGIPVWVIVFIIFIIIAMISGRSGRSNNKHISTGGLPLWLLLGMMSSGRGSHRGSWGGFSGGGRGGGGFGGFGGGSFGGGGAGGSW